MAKGELRMKESGNNVRRMIQLYILMKFDAHTRVRVDLTVHLEISASTLSTVEKI